MSMIKEHHHREAKPGLIPEFKGEFHFLSNFHTAQQEAKYEIDTTKPAIIALVRNNPIARITSPKELIIRYKSNEHFYQANKAKTWEQHLSIANAATAGIAKHMGSKKGYKGFKIVLREDWEDIKINIMRIGLNCKFRQNSHLAELLKKTNPAKLEEGNWHYDAFWGICFRKKSGLNWLGVLLMELRNNLILGLIPLDQPTLYS